MKNIFMSEESIEKKIHKVYFFLALFIGMVFSLAMPLFSEPDGMFHYTVSTNMAHLSNDLSAYGETRIGTNFTTQVESYQQGNVFEKYYKNEIKEMPMKDLPRESSFPSLINYNFWGHLVPALGVTVGHAVYPSIGVMIVFARLISVLIYSIAMFFIIRWVKVGKLLFFAVSLSPVIVSSFASLSYDSLTYVITAFTLALAINIMEKHKVEKSDFILMILSILALALGAKTNTKILAILPPLAMFVTYLKNKNVKLTFIERIKKREISVWKWIVSFIIFILASFVIITIIRPTVAFTLSRIFISFSINISPGLDVSNVFQSLLVAPFATINNVPYWVSAIWYVLLVLILFSEKKYISSPLVAYSALFLFLVGILAVYYSYATYIGGGGTEVSQKRFIGAIDGLQGRYFTPTLLLLSLFVGYEKFSFKIKPHPFITVFAIIVIFLSNGALLFGTLFGFYYLS